MPQTLVSGSAAGALASRDGRGAHDCNHVRSSWTRCCSPPQPVTAAPWLLHSGSDGCAAVLLDCGARRTGPQRFAPLAVFTHESG